MKGSGIFLTRGGQRSRGGAKGVGPPSPLPTVAARSRLHVLYPVFTLRPNAESERRRGWGSRGLVHTAAQSHYQPRVGASPPSLPAFAWDMCARAEFEQAAEALRILEVLLRYNDEDFGPALSACANLRLPRNVPAPLVSCCLAVLRARCLSVTVFRFLSLHATPPPSTQPPFAGPCARRGAPLDGPLHPEARAALARGRLCKHGSEGRQAALPARPRVSPFTFHPSRNFRSALSPAPTVSLLSPRRRRPPPSPLPPPSSSSLGLFVGLQESGEGGVGVGSGRNGVSPSSLSRLRDVWSLHAYAPDSPPSSPPHRCSCASPTRSTSLTSPSSSASSQK